MNFPFRRDHARRSQSAAGVVLGERPAAKSAHHMESSFSYDLCRFVLECSCGAHFDTPYIDEALEIRELHEMLAPMTDDLPA
jgi:hypothetical protein